jgi:GntR family transcriptional regulator
MVNELVQNPLVMEEHMRFSLNPATGIPVYRQIIQQIEDAILNGETRLGERLPTIRSLAVELKINPNTIAKAYSELEIRGVVQTQVGSGTYIAGSGRTREDEERDRKIRETLARFLGEMAYLGVDKSALMDLIKRN